MEMSQAIGFAVFVLGAVLILCSGIIVRACLINVGYFAGPIPKTLKGNRIIALVQALIALPLVTLPTAFVVHDSQLLEDLVIDSVVLEQTHFFQLTPYYAVTGPIWVGLVVWPVIFFTTRFFMVWCNHYGKTEEYEVYLCIGFTWALMAAVLYYYSLRQELSEVSMGLSIAAVVSVIPACLVLSTECTNGASFVSTFLYTWNMISPPRPRRLLDFTETPGGIGVFLFFALMMSLCLMLIQHATAPSVVDYAWRQVKARRTEI